ncbi:glycosyltransferase family 39 protein [Desulfococcaceae bacterium HSG8]|nr:glycosyltransferase family 39 protein [Desulfococcaceae bacterium HSG8]
MLYFKKIKSLSIILAIFILFVLLSVPHLSDPYFFAPDADRISMDGIFLLDFIRDLPKSLQNIYEYTITYYAKYPALSIGYRPVVFPLTEAPLYFVFGLSYLSAKMAVLLFLFTGMFFWYQLVRELYSSSYALISLLLWLTNPMVYQYAQHTMLEIPTLSMCIICMYYLYKYEANPSNNWAAIVLGMMVGLTIWTNQKSGFILPLLFIYPIVKKNPSLFISRNTMTSGFIIMICLIPPVFITLWLGDQNLSQSIGIMGSEWIYYEFELLKNISYLYCFHFTEFMLILILVGMIFSLITKDGRCLMFVCCIVCVYVFFTLIRVKGPRYSMYWIPCFTIFACTALEKTACYLEKFFKSRGRYIKNLIYCFPVLIQISFLPNVFVGHAEGYEEAAEYVLHHTKSPVIFFHGYANGQFVFFVRQNDPYRESVILRGSKIITSSSVTDTNKLQIHLHSAGDIYKSFSDYSVHFVVVESDNTTGIKIYDKLRELLRDNPGFKLRRTIPIKSNIKLLKDQNLLIYENMGYKDRAKDRMLTLPLPIVGKTINIKLEKLTQ